MADVRTLFSKGRILSSDLIYFELVSDLVFKLGGTRSYGDALPLKFDQASATWKLAGSLSDTPFKVYDPSENRFAAQGERGTCVYRDKQFVLVDMFSTVQWFPVKGNATAPGWSIVKVTSGTPVRNHPVLNVLQVDSTFTRFYAMLSPQGVKSGEYAVATWQGPAEITTGGVTPFGQGWGPQPSSWQPKRGSLGMSSLQSTTNTRCQMLGRYPIESIVGKTVGSINKGASGAVNVWTGLPGFEAASGMQITLAYNVFANLSSGKWCYCEWQNESWYLTAGEC